LIANGAVRAVLALLWLLHFLPLRVLEPIGRGLGAALFLLSRERRHVARTNLRLCFPDRGTAWREAVLRSHFRRFGRSLIESGIAWFGSEARLRAVVQVDGLEHLKTVGAGRFIALVPHFVATDLEGIRMTLEFRGLAVYAHQKNVVFDRFLLAARSRFNGTRMVARQEGVKAILRGMRDGYAVQLSPDMDLGAKDALFVPFFGVPTATVTALSRLSRLTGAAVVPIVIRQLDRGGGYAIRIHAPWDNWPGDSVEADTLRMNAFIEACVLDMPDQYLWLHKRFKTRPEGVPGVYD
jgi:Kdo2-lipid IVA lauroyltransferase/acyltransferase